MKSRRKNNRSRNKIRVAILGVGNVASILMQALQAKRLDGVWHERLGNRSISDIEIVAAFDIDRNKVGNDLSDAIFAPPNVSPKLSEVRPTGIIVKPGLSGSDVPPHLADVAIGGRSVVDELKSSGTEIVLNLIPSGMQESSLRYCREAVSAGCDFINATPAKIASDPRISRRFEESKLLVVGDDLMSQFGGTAFHKGILEFINNRGLKVNKSYQLDVGGGSETLNTITEEVKLTKRNIKSEAIAVEIPYKFQTVAGTTDYVDYMGNDRTSYFWISAKSFMGSETKVDIYLRTNDSTNAANVIFDVMRAVRYSREKLHVFGSPKEICGYGFKNLREPTVLRASAEQFLKKYNF